MIEQELPFAARMVATDIDGTIVPHGGTVSDRTRDALQACVAAGIEVVLVTGRPPRWVPPVVEATGFHPLAICSNGALVIDTADLRAVDMSTIAADTAAEAVERLRRAVPDLVFSAETPTEFRIDPGWEVWGAAERPDEGMIPTIPSFVTTSSVAEMVTGEIVKVMAVSLDATPDTLLDAARDAVGHLVSVTHSSGSRALVELGPLGVTKATTLARIAADRGIDAEEVVAFGDMPNDVQMLAWAGRGYAMTGAHPAAVAAASALAPPAAHDGVAQVLEGMLARRAVA